jgi:hypothetical protein
MDIFGTAPAGNSESLTLALDMKLSPSPNDTRVVAPGDEPSGRVDATFEPVVAGRPVEALRHVVLARPLHLDRHPDLTGDPGRLDQIVVVQPTAEATAHPQEVQGDVFLGDAQQLRGHRPATLGRLGRRPQLQLSVLEVGRAVLGLERRVREERVHVVGLHPVRSG